MTGIAIWLISMIPASAVFTGLGIYAMRRAKPMWFWSGTSVGANEVTDVKAYNRANGWMWIVFSLAMWASTIVGIRSMTVGGFVLIAVCLIGIPALMITYKNIWDKYRVRQEDA